MSRGDGLVMEDLGVDNVGVVLSLFIPQPKELSKVRIVCDHERLMPIQRLDSLEGAGHHHQDRLL